MFLVVDGLSRSGKLLLGKILLTSNSISTQSYTGYLERIIETIYFDSLENKNIESLIELLRLYFNHTLEDLRQFRLVSLNPLDSSYFRNSNLYRINKKQIDLGTFKPNFNSKSLFINHTHESIDFLQYGISKYNEILKKYINNYVIIVRNPAAQILSWYGRNYVENWKNINESPFKLYKLKFENNFFKNRGINNVPWYLNESFIWAESNTNINKQDLKKFEEKDIISLCVIFLLEKYLSFYRKKNLDIKFKPIFIMHESIHDKTEKVINNLFQKLKINIYSESEFKYILKEISQEKFGIKSADYSLKRCQELSLNLKISALLNDLHEKYKNLYLSI